MKFNFKEMERPERAEYPPYYQYYINLIPEGDVLDSLRELQESTRSQILSLDELQGSVRYAEGKWSIKEVIGHIIDTERIFSYRILSISRGETTTLPGFDQDEYVRNAGFDRRSMESLAEEFVHLRASNLALFRSFDESASQRKGKANQLEVSVRALIYMLAGHEVHHLNIIKERYLSESMLNESWQSPLATGGQVNAEATEGVSK